MRRGGVGEILPPGPPEPPALQMLRWRLRPIAFMESARREFGDAFTVWSAGAQRPVVMLSHPDTLRELWTAGDDHSGIGIGRSQEFAGPLGPLSLVVLGGAAHRTARQMISPLFRSDRVPSYAACVRDLTEREVASWPLDTPLTLHTRMRALTLEVIVRAVFGDLAPSRSGRLCASLMRLLNPVGGGASGMRAAFDRHASFRSRRRDLERASAEIDAVLLDEIAERRTDAEGIARGGMLSQLILARSEDGRILSDQALRDQVVTLLVTGHETTASALAWSVDLLVHQPDALELATADARHGDGSYLRAVVAESLRLRPVVPLNGRRLIHPLEVGKFTLPPGTHVTAAAWLTHTRPGRYPDPYRFAPERFLGVRPSGFEWIPFGGGARRCPGAALATLEMQLVLETMLWLRALRPVNRRLERARSHSVTFIPRTGTQICAVRRDG